MTRNHLEVACQRMAFARTEYEQLRLVMGRWLQCERERALDSNQNKPCWKAVFTSDEHDDIGRVTNAGYFDHAGGNVEDPDGDRSEPWCTPCRLRERMRPAFKAAKMAYGQARSAFWTVVRATAKRNGWKGKDEVFTLTERRAANARR